MNEFLMVLNLVLIESLLSVDNAAILAVMVKDLPVKDRSKALKYGLVGAYVFRGACLLFVTVLVKIIWLKIVGGFYLLYLTYSHFTTKIDSAEEGFDDGKSWVKKLKGMFGVFWGTVVLVEVMDLAFSIDNVFAAVAMTKNITLIMAGVAIGILAMRFVANYFVALIEKYPSLNSSAFIVIGLLGVKLCLSGVLHYAKSEYLEFVDSHSFDLVFSTFMMLIFIFPLIGKSEK